MTTLKSLVPVALVTVILWLIVTGLLWGFEDKEKNEEYQDDEKKMGGI